jgi:5-methyltetrahydropteroyltriglutamate--homocysteine methyltransferase
VIDVKDTQIESADQVAARIERAVSLLGDVDRIAYVNPDCGLWVLPRAVADGKIAALVAGRDRYLGL